MKYLELNREEGKKVFDELVQKNGNFDGYFDILNEDYKKMRMDFIKEINQIKIESNYDCDLKLAIIIHRFFNINRFENFNNVLSSNYDFWRYICLRVFPDIIYKRHNFTKEYFYEKNVRLYFPTLWWYIEFGYQKNYDDTYNTLKSLSTDYILNLVERPGREGLYIEVMRRIIYYFTTLSNNIINKRINGKTLFRRIMIQNTARIDNINLVIENKTDDYVRSLFEICGVKII